MNPGQRRTDTPDGQKAHSSCVALADQRGGITEIKEMGEVIDVLGRDRVGEWLIEAVSDKRVRDAIREATISAFPSKSTQLRMLMLRAADNLVWYVDQERKAASYSKALTPGIVAAMVQAEMVLRTVAIYVIDDDEGGGWMHNDEHTEQRVVADGR